MAAKDVQAGRAHVLVSIRDRFTKGLKLAEQKLKNFGSYVASTAGIIAGGTAGTLAWPVKLAADMETTEASFETMLKSGDAAKKLLSELNQFAESTPFQFPEIADAAKKLLAFGSSAKSLNDELRMLGDISSGVGVPLGELAEIYGKARVQGRLFAEDMNQLSGRGIDINEQLAAQFGVQKTAVRKLVEEGKVGFPQLASAFKTITTTGDFAGGMERQSKTLNGLFSTLLDNVAAVSREIGNTLLPFFKNVVTVGIDVAKFVQNFVVENKELIATVAKYLVLAGSVAGVFVAVGATALGASFVIGTLASAFVAIAGVIGFVFSPLGAFVGLLIGAGAAIWKFRDKIVQALAPVMAFFNPVIEVAKEFYRIFMDTFNGIVLALSTGQLGMAGAIAMAGLSTAFWTGVDVIAQAVDLILGKSIFGAIAQNLLSGNWSIAASIAMEKVKLVIIQAWEGIKTIWYTAVWKLGDIWDDMVLGMKTTFRSAMKGIAGLIGGEFGRNLMEDQQLREAADNRNRNAGRRPAPGVEVSKAELDAQQRLIDLQNQADGMPTTTDLAVQSRDELDAMITAMQDKFAELVREMESTAAQATNFANRGSLGGGSRIAGAFTAAGAVALGGKRNDAMDKVASNTSRIVAQNDKMLMRKGPVFG